MKLPRLRLWPRSLASRTAVLVLLGLVVVQTAGLTIHALDRIDLQRMAEARDLATRVMGLYRVIIMSPADSRAATLAGLNLSPGMTATLDTEPAGPRPGIRPVPVPVQRVLRLSLNLVPIAPELRPRELRILWEHDAHRLITAIHMPDGLWLNVGDHPPPPRIWHEPGFLAAFLMMTAVAALLTIWAARRLTAPVRLLAQAADRLGRDVNAPPLPEDGPSEVAAAAMAFNTMAGRIRRFVQDRTVLLSAIGHDLRTPITRLKLRAEFIDDDEQREKFLADLDELDAMVSATLAFGRDMAGSEQSVALDLPALLRTVLDEASDARQALEHMMGLADGLAADSEDPAMEDSAEEAMADRLGYDGPEHLTVMARPMAIKRAMANLVANAVAYGGGAMVRLVPPASGQVTIRVEDDGPGIPAADIARMFEPFQRLERSRNRETGGTGLGLAIARNILRAHGGDVELANRPQGGLVAVVSLPV